MVQGRGDDAWSQCGRTRRGENRTCWHDTKQSFRERVHRTLPRIEHGQEKMKGTKCNLQARGWRDWCRQGGKQRAFCPLTCLSSAPYWTCWDFRLPTLLSTCVAASLSILLPPTPQPPLQPAASLFPGPHNLDSDAGHGPSCLLRTGLGPFFFILLISQQNLSSVAHLEFGMVVAGARVGFPSLLDLCTVPWNYPLDLLCVLVTQSC